MSDKVEKAWFEVSEDELCARMLKKVQVKDSPAHKAVEVLEAGIDSVLKTLGVDVTRDDIPDQMNSLGILMTEHTDERAPQLNGFFIYLMRPAQNDMIPYAWVGSAQINSEGKCCCEIHRFIDERMSEITGIKVVQ